MKDISERIEALSPEKRLLLLKKLKKRSGAQPAGQIIPVRRSEDNTYPLSFEQERLWFLENLDPNTPVYNISGPLKLYGKVDLDVFHKSIDEIVRRHESLRTTFKYDGETAVQIIAPHLSLELPFVDFRDLDGETKLTRVRKLIKNEAKQPFDLTRGPLLHHIMMQLEEEEYMYFVKTHHLVADGLSFRVFLQELKELYSDFSSVNTSRLPDLPVQYVDYVDWQRKRLDDDYLEKLLSYWKNRMKGPLTLLELPADYPEVSREVHKGTVEEYDLPPDLVKKIRTLGQKEGFTPVVILLAVFKMLLLRYTEQEDIIVGMPFANRIRPELSSLIGFFANIVVLRSDLSGDPTFLELLSRIKEVVLGAMEHQELPMDRLVKALKPERNLSHSPFFNVMFNIVEQLGDFKQESSGIIWEPVKPGSEATEFVLTWEIVNNDAALRINVEYSADIFNASRIRRMMRHYRVLLAEVAVNPNRPIREIPIISEEERRQILVDFNDTHRKFDETLCLHRMFEHQARRTPANIAAVFKDQAVTYDELECRSNRLAHYLRQIGIRRDTPAALCLDRSLEMVTGLMGILKAGGAYLPIEPDTPPSRIRTIVTDAGAPVMITRQALHQEFSLQHTTLLCYDTHRERILRQPAHQVNDPGIGSENLCSVYYTSGSTGKPRGVANVHKGWVNRMLWMQSHYKFTPSDRILQKTTLTFDDSAVEFFWPLSVGACVALMEPQLHKDPRAILDDAIRYHITLLQFVPSMLTLFLDAVKPGDKEKLSCLKYVISSGEALQSGLVGKFTGKLDCTLHNQWGLTEVSIDSTMHTCIREDTREGVMVPIGKAFANNRIYILDRYLNPVPVGIPGYLYIGGVGLARGYINNVPETVNAFIPDPFKPGDIIYSTGDRGYFNEEGSVVFLGRLDEQVKIRGQRVELMEIESILATHPGISGCAVVAKKYADGYSVIAYYVVSGDTAAEAGTETLREFTGKYLPDYMVPSRFIRVEQLPYTQSGKINRKLLPDPGEERPDLKKTYVPPTGKTEKEIAAIWQDILGIKEIGVHDSFFDLGGSSIESARTITRINNAFDLNIPLRAIFEHPTVAGLVEQVDRLYGRIQSAAHRSIPKLPLQPYYELSHNQMRYWHGTQMGPRQGDAGIEINRLVTILEGPLRVEILQEALQLVLKRRDILSITYGEKDSLPVMIINENMDVPLDFYDLSSSSLDKKDEILAGYLMRNFKMKFNIEKGPLGRSSLYRIDRSGYLLFLSGPHISFDGESFFILMKDLAEIYNALRAGRGEPSLPPAVRYVDYVQWHNRRLQDGELQEQAGYWERYINEKIPVSQLPYDYQENVSVPAKEPSRILLLKLGAENLQRLQKLASSQDATLFSVMLAAVKTWIAIIANQTVVTVGTVFSGRTHSQLEDIPGLMMNPLPIRSNLSGNPDCREIIARTKEMLMEAYSNQEFPLDLVAHKMRKVINLNEDIYSIVFVAMEIPAEAFKFEGLNTRFCPLMDFIYGSKANNDGFIDHQYNSVNDILIEMLKESDDIRLLISYNHRKYRSETIKLYFDHFLEVLNRFLQSLDLRLSQFPPLEIGELDEIF